ncbi:hypothetical protein [Paenibacillus arenilitoris]|uniref:Uncharacterized protein n=1 Tax=Paenibacillus arenilitoris TaxID=2772299 RepID=A0A927CGR3_9BACL|nr:hypothetical protein [Paenibacillus arenilitoris]MBD2867793.1 hypothetical protein [Paenibacillus arenilitoris]
MTGQPDMEKINRKLGTDDIVERLSDRISGSELNTLLLKVFQEKTRTSTPGDLLRRFGDNRFVQPAHADPRRLKRLELDLLDIASRHGAEALQLSPVAPLGCSSVVAPADQNKTISALRGTEVVSDASNVLALHACELIRTGQRSNKDEFIRLCATHRHVRSQYFGDAPGMLPHFHVFCMVTSGIDKGSYGFEIHAFREHVAVYRDIFRSLLESDIEISLSERGGYKDAAGLIERIARRGEEDEEPVAISVAEPNADNRYYDGLQFTIKVNNRGESFPIGDGGFVDWPQRLLGNRKERMLISAIGLDRLLSYMG